MFRTLAFFTVVGFQTIYVQADTDDSHTLYYKPNGQNQDPPYSFYKDDSTCSSGAQLTEVDPVNHEFTLELGTYTIDECPSVSGHALEVAGSSTSFTMGPSGVDWQCSITAHQDSMSGRFVAPTGTCKEPYGTADGRPAYDSTLPDCTGAAVDANGVVQQTCLCSRCGDIRVIVALPGESCDSDGFWDAKTSGLAYYIEKGTDGIPAARDRENFGYDENCDIKCEQAYEAETQQHAKDAGRRFLRTDFLKASYNGQNYVCLSDEALPDAKDKNFECHGCKKCKDDAEYHDYGYKDAINGLKGCFPWCKSQATKKGLDKICSWNRCGGCKACIDEANKDTYNNVAYVSADIHVDNKESDKTKSLFKQKDATEDIQLDGELHGGCFPWCRSKFFNAEKGPEKVCTWKRCSGCKACQIWAENHNDATNDGFRYKINTIDIESDSNSRKGKAKKKYGGCLKHCSTSAQNVGLEKICKWRGCGGCEVCVRDNFDVSRMPTAVKDAAVNQDSVGNVKTIGTLIREKEEAATNRMSSKITGYADKSDTQKTQDIRNNFRIKKINKRDCSSTNKGECGCAGPFVCTLDTCGNKNCWGCIGCQS